MFFIDARCGGTTYVFLTFDESKQLVLIYRFPGPSQTRRTL